LILILVWKDDRFFDAQHAEAVDVGAAIVLHQDDDPARVLK
jgi:hypothetical protein